MLFDVLVNSAHECAQTNYFAVSLGRHTHTHTRAPAATESSDTLANSKQSNIVHSQSETAYRTSRTAVSGRSVAATRSSVASQDRNACSGNRSSRGIGASGPSSGGKQLMRRISSWNSSFGCSCEAAATNHPKPQTAQNLAFSHLIAKKIFERTLKFGVGAVRSRWRCHRSGLLVG